MAATDNLSQTFQLNSPVTELAERSSEISQCSENEEQDELYEKRKLFNPSGRGEQNNVFCQKLSAVRWKKVLTLVVVSVDFFLINASLSLIGAFFTTKVASYSYIAILICVTTNIILINQLYVAIAS